MKETLADIAKGLEAAIRDPNVPLEYSPLLMAARRRLNENEIGRLGDALTRLKFDLDETLKAVLHHFGPDGAHTVASHVMLARRSRDTNAEIDELEKVFGSVEEHPTHPAGR